MPLRRILFDAMGIVSFPTGLGKYSYYLLKAMLSKREFRFTVLHQSDLPRSHPLFYLRHEQLEFMPARARVIGPGREIGTLKLRKYINQHDLYHCTSSYLPAFGITIPSVVTIHDLKYLLFPSFFKNHLKILYYSWIIRRGARKAKRVIAISASTKKDLIDLGVPVEKIVVVHEAVTIPIELVDLDSRLPDEVDNKPYLFFVGDNRPHKNLSRIITAYHILIDKLGESSPNFIFAGVNFNNLRRKYANTKMSTKLFFLNTVPEKTLVALYKRAVALVYPSLYEGFGLPILEAMAAGTPVITSNCSSLPEVAGNAAILVDPYDVKQIFRAMLKLVQDKSERDKLSQLGLRRVREFSWEKAACLTIDVYEKIMSHGKD